jgi:hypothetical protein
MRQSRHTQVVKVANIAGTLPPVGISGAASADTYGIRSGGMKLTFIRKTRESTTGNCPAIYQREDGRYVIQGWRITNDERAQLRDLADNEDAIVVPADVIAGIVDAHRP